MYEITTDDLVLLARDINFFLTLSTSYRKQQ